MIKRTLFLFVIGLLVSCNTTKTIQAPDITQLDTMVIQAPKPDHLKDAADYELPVYHETYTRYFDLIHTKLKVSFDWEKERVNGEAELTVTPYFYPQAELILDAKAMDIHSINFVGNSSQLAYENDGVYLKIKLGKTYKKGEQLKINIKYTAKPTERKIGGSRAITSDQGLFFINANGKEDKPQQIWTQGETENNSVWFPTIDHSNEKCTEEIYITVQDRFQTLSNGLLISSKKNKDGTRTDYWKMDMPHTPYLFMLAVGEFAIIEETWNGKPIKYYVEHDFKDDAKAIFSNTKEMLTFFSEKLGVDYPWPSYSQIVVRDYVSGAMENTTAVVFGEFVQKHKDDLLINNNEGIVAHEMFHHWFGDLVTCESWSNLTLNEGFASYSEYLWNEHHLGKEEADYGFINSKSGYLRQAAYDRHPLINFGYEEKEKMFDGHSYQKGAQILHMLRNFIGDDAFFAGLKKYLNDNKFESTEAHHLRLAMEAVSGKDLNWFFNQWFFEKGHPELNIETGYADGKSYVTIEQTQDVNKNIAVFKLPIDIDFYVNGQVYRKRYWMTKRSQTFAHEFMQKPTFVNVDPDRILLYEKVEDKTDSEYLFQFKNAKNFVNRYEAFEALKNKNNAHSKTIVQLALNDPHWRIRKMAISYSDQNDATAAVEIAKKLTSDTDPRVRSEALSYLGQTGDKKYFGQIEKMVEKEKNPSIKSSGLVSLFLLEPSYFQKNVNKYAKTDNKEILNTIAQILVESDLTNDLSFYESNWKKMDNYEAISFFNMYGLAAMKLDDMNQGRALMQFKEIGLTDSSLWRRFAVAKTMSEMKRVYEAQAEDADNTSDRNHLQQAASQVGGFLSQMLKKEKDPDLVRLLESLI